jgi:AraC-like DNA-binding protein
MSEKITLQIKNMVCSRCSLVIETALTALGLKVKYVELGEVEVVRSGVLPTLKEIEKELNRFNFQLIKSTNEVMVERVKHILLSLMNSNQVEDINLSEHISDKIAKNYSQISKTFSRIEGITIEKFFIQLKIEKASEMISYGEQNFSQIAYNLGYKTLQHLSRQFKQVTGMSMSEYKKLNEHKRGGIDKVWS